MISSYLISLPWLSCMNYTWTVEMERVCACVCKYVVQSRSPLDGLDKAFEIDGSFNNASQFGNMSIWTLSMATSIFLNLFLIISPNTLFFSHCTAWEPSYTYMYT